MKSILPLLLICVGLASCSLEKKAQKSFSRGQYQSSIYLYQKLLNKGQQSGKANYFIAESYRLSNRLKEAESFYEKAGGRGVDKDSVKFFYAQALKANGRYDEAKTQLEELSASASSHRMKDRAHVEIDGLAYIRSLEQRENYYKVKNLELINTPAAEYSPVFLNNELYFTTNRGNGKIYEATGSPFTDIYKVASRGANVDITTLKALPEPINDPSRNEGCVAFTLDGSIMVFAKGNSSKKNQGADVDLYISRFRNGSWMAPTKIPHDVNTRYRSETDTIALKYSWDSTPAFSPDGRTLYFASNRINGYGGTDIYSAQMDSRGRFRKIRNLGPEINTSGNEMFPYVSEDGRFFFSSDGHPGYGGLDLFVIEREDGKNVIRNLGKPMNSSGDDFGIFLFRPDRGFFTSNRVEDGKGDDDIYTFIDEDPNLKVVNYYLQGIVYYKDQNEQRQILSNANVTLLDAEGDIMQDYVTGDDGKFLFKVYPNEDYNLLGEADGYLTTREEYSTQGRAIDPKTLKDLVTNITFDTLLVLERKAKNVKFVLENIYFDFDKADITRQSAIELNKLVQLLKDNPEIKIEMGSHTDSLGSFDYNIDLSQRRAESTVKYLIQNGIAPDRLEAKGYGERQPIAPNSNPDGTDNPDGRARNRRTEFKILEIGSIPKPLGDEVGDSEYFEEDKYFRE